MHVAYCPIARYDTPCMVRSILLFALYSLCTQYISCGKGVKHSECRVNMILGNSRERHSRLRLQILSFAWFRYGEAQLVDNASRQRNVFGAHECSTAA